MVWLTIYSYTVVYGGNECGESGHLSIFTLLKHLMMILKYNFSGLHFYTLLKTLIACKAMHLRFCKVKTLLNNAFSFILEALKNECTNENLLFDINPFHSRQ